MCRWAPRSAYRMLHGWVALGAKLCSCVCAARQSACLPLRSQRGGERVLSGARGHESAVIGGSWTPVDWRHSRFERARHARTRLWHRVLRGVTKASPQRCRRPWKSAAAGPYYTPDCLRILQSARACRPLGEQGRLGPVVMMRTVLLRTVAACCLCILATACDAPAETVAPDADAAPSPDRVAAEGPADDLASADQRRAGPALHHAILLPLTSDDRSFRARVAVRSWQRHRPQMERLYELSESWGRMVDPQRYPELPAPALVLAVCPTAELGALLPVMHALAPTHQTAPISRAASQRWRPEDCPQAHKPIAFRAAEHVISGREAKLVLIQGGSVERPRSNFVLHDTQGTILKWRVDDPFARGASECSVYRVRRVADSFEVESKCTMAKSGSSPRLEHQIRTWSIHMAGIKVETERERIKVEVPTSTSNQRTYIEY